MTKSLSVRIAAAIVSAVGLFSLLDRPAQAADAALVAAATKEGQLLWYNTLVQNQAARPLAD